ncbi:MAG TPA: LamG-like jellyroll fold domain-containing protein [Verrucomicrobiae bacterium]
MNSKSRNLGQITSAFFCLCVVLHYQALAQQGSNCVAPASGLVSWWQAEGTAFDCFGTNNGIAGGALTYAPGEVGNAFSFNGTDSFLRIPASSSLDVGLGPGLTLEAWIKTSATVPMPVFDGSYFGGYGVLVWINMAGSGSVYAGLTDIYSSDHILQTSPGVLTNNAFNHVALTYDKTSGVARIFVNGVVAAQSTFESFTARTTTDLYIGHRQPTAPYGVAYYSGLIDDPSIYGRALATNEVWAIYWAGAAGKCLTNSTPPVILVQPQSQTVDWGTPVTFSVAATGTPPLTYEWRKDDVAISGANSAAYSIPSVQTNDAGTYSVLVTNAAGWIISSNAVLTVNLTPPVIVAQPQSQTVNSGGMASFTVSATGTPPLTYEWRKDDVAISGANGAVYSIPSVQTNDAGTYSVLVSNVSGWVISSNAILTVVPPPSCVPSPAGLVSWWAAEGGLGDNLGGNDCVAGGALGYGPGEVGQAFSFDGKTSYIRIPAAPSLDVGQGPGLTLEAWIKPTNRVAAPVFDGSAGGRYGVLVWLNLNGSGTLYAGLEDTRGYNHILTTSAGVVTNGVFNHIALTYDKASGLARLYVNGVAAAQQNLGSFAARTSTDMYIGHRQPTAPYGVAYFGGLIDEPSVYGRALSGVEIESIYAAGSAGKCFTPVAPSILLQPADLVVTVGSNAVFTVRATGSPLLSYQWDHAGVLIEGATSSTLVLSNVNTAQAGLYSVLVSNSVGSVLSSNANLAVNLPPAVVRVPNITLDAGQIAAVPIVLLANGNENALAFSLNFNPSVLSYSNIVVGSGAPGAALLINDSQAAMGKLGVALGLPADATFAAGTQEVAAVKFNVPIFTNATTATLAFGNVPIPLQLADTAGHQLPATFANGSITVAPAELEGDVSPRSGGDHVVNLSDWVVMGRMAAGLDFPTNDLEFQRADCAPRGNLGDGAITIIDWVQAGRYAAGLDPLTAVGGPTGTPNPSSFPAKDGSTRVVRVSNAILMQDQPGTTSITLDAQGDESALGFSLRFPTNLVTFVSASLGFGASQAVLNLNARQADAGSLGFALALPSGSLFPAGTREVVAIKFRAKALASGTSSLILNDTPVVRQVSDAMASALETSYVDGSLTINPPPSLAITRADQSIQLSWPSWATNFVLQGTEGPLMVASQWTNLTVPFGVTNNLKTVTLPLSDGTRYYRLGQQ